jgi:hypothetical protein
MMLIEELLAQICERGHWTHLTGAAGPDHVHEILRWPFDPETILRLMKRWLGQALFERYRNEPGCPQPGTGATWWAECGSIKRSCRFGFLNRLRKLLRAFDSAIEIDAGPSLFGSVDVRQLEEEAARVAPKNDRLAKIELHRKQGLQNLSAYIGRCDSRWARP